MGSTAKGGSLSFGLVSFGETPNPPCLWLEGRRHRSSHQDMTASSLTRNWYLQSALKLPSKFGVSHMPSGREGKKISLPCSCNFQLLNYFSSVTAEQLWLHLETVENEQFWPKDFSCSRDYFQMCPDCRKGSLCRSVSHISS